MPRLIHWSFGFSRLDREHKWRHFTPRTLDQPLTEDDRILKGKYQIHRVNFTSHFCHTHTPPPSYLGLQYLTSKDLQLRTEKIQMDFTKLNNTLTDPTLWSIPVNGHSSNVKGGYFKKKNKNKNSYFAKYGIQWEQLKTYQPDRKNPIKILSKIRLNIHWG